MGVCTCHNLLNHTHLRYTLMYVNYSSKFFSKVRQWVPRIQEASWESSSTIAIGLYITGRFSALVISLIKWENNKYIFRLNARTCGKCLG